MDLLQGRAQINLQDVSLELFRNNLGLFFFAFVLVELKRSSRQAERIFETITMQELASAIYTGSLDGDLKNRNSITGQYAMQGRAAAVRRACTRRRGSTPHHITTTKTKSRMYSDVSAREEPSNVILVDKPLGKHQRFD